MLSLSADHVAAFTLWPHGPRETTVVCELLFHPDEQARPSRPVGRGRLLGPGQPPGLGRVRERPAGMASRAYTGGWFAPMEEPSLDIRRYVLDRLGEDGDHFRLARAAARLALRLGLVGCRGGGAGGAGSAAAWALARAGARVLGLEQFELGHRGASRPRPHHPPLLPHARLRAPGRPRLPGLGGAGAGGEERLVVTTGGLDLFPADAAIRPAPTGPAWRPAASLPVAGRRRGDAPLAGLPAGRRRPRPLAGRRRIVPAARGTRIGSAWRPATAPPCSTGPR